MRSVTFKTNDMSRHPKLYGDCSSLRSLTNNQDLYASTYVSKIIKLSIFWKSNNRNLPTVSRLAQKLPNGFLPTGSGPAPHISNIPTFLATSRGTRAPNVGNRKPNLDWNSQSYPQIWLKKKKLRTATTVLEMVRMWLDAYTQSIQGKVSCITYELYFFTSQVQPHLKTLKLLMARCTQLILKRVCVGVFCRTMWNGNLHCGMDSSHPFNPLPNCSRWYWRIANLPPLNGFLMTLRIRSSPTLETGFGHSRS